MKANAPEKIYFSLTEYGIRCYTEAIPFEREYIEYTLTDAFIEKACEWLSKHFYDGCYQFYDNDGMWIDADSMLDDFKNYMKGE